MIFVQVLAMPRNYVRKIEMTTLCPQWVVYAIYKSRLRKEITFGGNWQRGETSMLDGKQQAQRMQ